MALEMTTVFHRDHYECANGHTFNDERGCPVCDAPFRKATVQATRARNYGIHGGKDMGIVVNEALKTAWQTYRRDCGYVRDYPDMKAPIYWRAESKTRLLLLCRIRKAGRMGL